jgi:DNA polymerase
VDTATRVYGDTATYGGKLCENETQAGCRDLLADAMLAFDRINLPLVMHVHDEPVLEVAGLTDATVEAIMCKSDWAQGFPLAVEHHRGARYRK